MYLGKEVVHHLEVAIAVLLHSAGGHGDDHGLLVSREHLADLG
jgi:hypothetical protein